MAIKRLWRGRPRGLSELPTEVRESPRYDSPNWFLDRALLSVNGRHLKLEFESGRVEYWKRGETGWGIDLDGPSQHQLLEGLPGSATPPADGTSDQPNVVDPFA